MARTRPRSPPHAERWLDLLRQAQSGDAGATERLLAEIRPYLKGKVEHLQDGQSPGVADASDLVQDCLLKIARHLHEVRATTGAELLAWLRQIARNDFLDHQRDAHRQKRDAAQQVPLPEDSQGRVLVPSDTSSPSQQAARREEEEQLEHALSRLGEADQKVIRLRYLEGREWPDVACEMGCSETAVKRRFFRAIKKLGGDGGMQP